MSDMVDTAVLAPRVTELASLVADKYGIELSRYSRTSIDLLIKALERTEPSDVEARLRLLIGTFSIGETCFMRHAEQFDALRRLVRSIPAMREGAPLSVWSAGCATGEEPFSLLGTLRDELGSYPVEVVGCDINPQFLERARRGEYRPWSLRGVDREATKRWLHVSAEGARVDEALVSRVKFREQNLVADGFPTGVHVVFCRNVLMYFHRAAARAVLARMAHAVEPGGLLFLGYSDPTPDPEGSWVKEEIDGVRYFRRAFHRAYGAVSPPRRTPREPASVTAQPAPINAAPGHDTKLPHACTTQSDASSRAERRDAARALAQRGDMVEALRALDALAREAPLDVDTHMLVAMLADESGDPQRTLDAARRAALLAPDAALAQFLLARAFSAVGEPRRASVHLELARTCLARVVDAAAPLAHGQGLTAAQLARMIDAAE